MAQKAQFIVYDKRTGAIVHSMSCHPDKVARVFASLIGRNYRHFGRIDGVSADGRTQVVDLETLEVITKPDGFDPPRRRDLIAQDYAHQRRLAFEAAGLDVWSVIDVILDGSPAELAQLRARRATIKSQIPKPSKGG